MATRRTLGSIRKLPSGRWQARYRDRAGTLRPARCGLRMTEAPRLTGGPRTPRTQAGW